jgi:hypothetical protein
VWVDPGAPGPWPWRACEVPPDRATAGSGAPGGAPGRRGGRARVCPACRTVNAAAARSCTGCDWPFPPPRPETVAAREGDAAARRDHVARPVAAGRLVRRTREACALLVIAFAAGVLLAHAGVPGELATGLLFAVLFVGISALGRSLASSPPRRGD